MRPVARRGAFVFVSVPEGTWTGPAAEASIREAEGLTLVLEQQAADGAGFPYHFVAGWITLRVHSALDAVGLTATVSGTLASAGISCNVLAGFHHDHLLVPYAEVDRALDVLEALAAGAVEPAKAGRTDRG